MEDFVFEFDDYFITVRDRYLRAYNRLMFINWNFAFSERCRDIYYEELATLDPEALPDMRRVHRWIEQSGRDAVCKVLKYRINPLDIWEEFNTGRFDPTAIPDRWLTAAPRSGRRHGAPANQGDKVPHSKRWEHDTALLSPRWIKEAKTRAPKPERSSYLYLSPGYDAAAEADSRS